MCNKIWRTHDNNTNKAREWVKSTSASHAVQRVHTGSERSTVMDLPKESPNWILQHPVYHLMKNLDVEDSAQVHAAFLVYMDLTEVRNWKEVSCAKSDELQLVLLEGKEKEGSPMQTVLPLPVHQSVSHRSLRLHAGLPEVNGWLGDPRPTRRSLPGRWTSAAQEETAAALSIWWETSDHTTVSSVLLGCKQP
ncbi:tRNA-splicing endonuclease subunit Sen15 [Dunckerocampus dactyliophorus]|uniref:tRNA-splicing endonuclease subunit Sen15 n=1 Tax=Dunckerocampus dactyliophorus TaxID=161453 RepID=UPI002405F8EE|nr:tRNA-splicing endonuclease subunit Sen15 [Dunckerocampus dactyliophorus]